VSETPALELLEAEPGRLSTPVRLVLRTVRLSVVTALVIAVIGLIWYGVVVVFGISSFVLPKPNQVFTDAGWSQVGDASRHTIVRVVVGFAVGNLFGVVLALLTVASSFVAALLYPFALSFRSIPIVALAPFITLALGRGLPAIIVITTMLVFFPTYVNVSLGLRSVDRQLLELMRVLNCSKLQVFFRVRLPTALPSLMSSLRIAAPTAVLGVLIGEWVIGVNGLGQLILNDSINLDLPTMWAGVLVAASLSLLAFAGVGVAERTVLNWRRQE
jgi:NitT/TauT family transport system permease protein